MKKASLIAMSTVLVASLGTAQAAILFNDDFNVDSSSNWTVSSGPDFNDAVFAYDYSTMGIPPAPNNADTKGLRLRANLPPGTTSALTGLSVSPNGQSFTGDYVVRFHAWQNYGGTGTTQLTTYSVGATGTTPQRPGGTIDGVMFGATSDGGSASDYRAYGPGSTGAQLTGVYSAASQNNTAAYYLSLFPGGATSPAVQGPTLTSPAGTPAFTWQLVEIYKVGNALGWKINGVPLANVNLSSITLAGSNISLGQSDINAGAATAPDLVFGLIDNLVVESTVPEPATLGALGLASSMLARRRK